MVHGESLSGWQGVGGGRPSLAQPALSASGGTGLCLFSTSLQPDRAKEVRWRHVDVAVGGGGGSGLRAPRLRRLGSARYGVVTAGGWQRGAVGVCSIAKTLTTIGGVRRAYTLSLSPTAWKGGYLENEKGS